MFSRLMPAAGGRFEMLYESAPSGDERVTLQRRRAELQRAMGAAERREIEALVGALLDGYAPGRAHKGDPGQVMRMFVQALQGIPVWAIAGACSAWNRGAVDGHDASYAPSPPDLRKAALTQLEPFQDEAHKISVLLSARVTKPDSPEDRQATADRVRKWVADRTPVSPMMVPLTEQEFEVEMASKMSRWKAEPVKPSAELMALMKRGEDRAADVSQVAADMRG